MKPVTYLKVAQVAARTGLTERSIYDKIKDGSLASLGGRNGIPEDAVTQFILDRQQATAARIGGDLTRFAKDARNRARQLGGKRGTHYPSDTDAVAVFGPAAVDAARIPDDARVCRWCWANVTASAHGGIQPGHNYRLYPAFVALLGPPCSEDAKRLMAAWKPSPDHGEDTAAEPVQSVPAARTAAAMSRAEIRRLAAPKGHKKCGVPVGVRCECHTSDRPRTAATASAKPKPKPRRRVDIHPCGCTCPEHRSQS